MLVQDAERSSVKGLHQAPTHEQLGGGRHGPLHARNGGHDGLQEVARPGCLTRAAGRHIAQQRQRRDLGRLPWHLSCTVCAGLKRRMHLFDCKV